jgi:hypothetical protein
MQRRALVPWPEAQPLAKPDRAVADAFSERNDMLTHLQGICCSSRRAFHPPETISAQRDFPTL